MASRIALHQNYLNVNPSKLSIAKVCSVEVAIPHEIRYVLRR